MFIVVALFGDEVRRSLRLLEGPLNPGFGPLQVVALVVGLALFLAGAVFHDAVWRRIRTWTGRSGKSGQ